VFVAEGGFVIAPHSPTLLLVERFLLWAEEAGAYLADTDGTAAMPLEPESVADLLTQWEQAGMPGPKTIEEA
jgi:hypothetical protein